MDRKAKQTRLVDAAGDELAALLWPVTPQTFVHEYWGKKPLHVKGVRDKFKGFFDGAGFMKAVGTPGRGGAEFLRASFDSKTPKPKAPGEPTEVTLAFPIPPELAVPLYEAGATLCATELESRVPRLAHFAAAIKRQLGYPGRINFNSYLSGPGSGLNWHFDARIASTLQLEGSKRWRYANLAVEWPRGNGAMMTDGTARYTDATALARAEWERLAPLEKSAVTEVVLEPGDLLVLPAGTWHDAAGGAGGSLALNLAFVPIAYTPIIGDLLDSVLIGDPGWRAVMPLLPRPNGAPGEVDPRALEAVAKQLENAAQTLRTMAADSAAYVTLWSSYVQNTSPPSAPPSAPPTAPVAPTDRFRVRADGNVYVRTAEKGSRLSFSVGTHLRTEAVGDAMRFVQRALEAREFVASDCLAWGGASTQLGWNDVEQVLLHLVSQGLLERIAK